jgi:hypothetical protein
MEPIISDERKYLRESSGEEIEFSANENDSKVL